MANIQREKEQEPVPYLQSEFTRAGIAQVKTAVFGTVAYYYHGKEISEAEALEIAGRYFEKHRRIAAIDE